MQRKLEIRNVCNFNFYKAPRTVNIISPELTTEGAKQ